jgi:hypothetical protein
MISDQESSLENKDFGGKIHGLKMKVIKKGIVQWTA